MAKDGGGGVAVGCGFSAMEGDIGLNDLSINKSVSDRLNLPFLFGKL